MSARPIATDRSSAGMPTGKLAVWWLLASEVVIFGGLLAGHYFRGWRGRKAVHWTLAGFTALMLAYIGSKVVLELILRR